MPSPSPAAATRTPPEVDFDQIPVERRWFVTLARSRGWLTDWNIATIPLTEISPTGVTRDGIAPIDDPKFAAVGDVAEELDPAAPVVHVDLNGDARAYPLRVLIRHEIVNDTVGGVPVVITYCPLCNSAIAFGRNVNGETLRFGVSGFLRNSDLVMWDDRTESLWQQITGEAIVGKLAGARLNLFPANTLSWGSFVEAFPEGKVLLAPAAADADSAAPLYAGYDRDPNNRPFLFNGALDYALPPLSRVAAFNIDGEAVAYPFSFLAERLVVNDTVGDADLVLFFDPLTRSPFAARSGSPEDMPVAGSSAAFSRRLRGRLLSFEPVPGGGIVDRETGSSWSRAGLATGGELQGARLEPVAHADHFWFAWSAFAPGTEIRSETAALAPRR